MVLVTQWSSIYFFIHSMLQKHTNLSILEESNHSRSVWVRQLARLCSGTIYIYTLI